MRIKQLQYLIELKRYGSFLKASQEMFVAQPSISAAIKELENELGYTLLKRSNKGIAFTAKGERVLEKAMLIMDTLDEIRSLRFDPVEMVSGVVRIGCGSRLCSAIVVDATIALHKLYPDLLINMQREGAFEVLQAISAERLDLGLIQIDAVEQEAIQLMLRQQDMLSEVLFQDEMVFVVGPNHPLRNKQAVKLSEILQYPYVTAKGAVSPAVKTMLRDHGYSGEIIHIDDVAGLRQFVAQSEAVTYMAKHVARSSNLDYNDNLIGLNIADFNWYCSVAWVHSQQPLSAAEQVVVDELTMACQKYK